MNLFPLDNDPFVAAEYNCDIHCNKILLEAAQMLANCFSLECLNSAPKTKSGEFRKHSYLKHPVSQWVMKTKSNMLWTISHAIQLELERLLAYFNPHFSYKFIIWALDNINKSLVPDGDLTPFAVAINKDKNCRRVPGFDNLSAVDQYRLYYIHDKPFATWTGQRKVPEWFKK